MSTHPVDYKRHIASLDGLRGFAICIVFLHHYYPRDRFDPISVLASVGWVGVDVFFVLSGFLITGILIDTVHKPHSLRNFFARRSLRLFPVYLLMVGGIVLFSHPLQIKLTWQHIPLFAYGANICTALHIFPDTGPYLRFRHLWSLAVEEQFYLLWAPLVFLLVRRNRVMTACMIGIALAILLRVIATADHVANLAIYQNLPTRMDSILSGSLLALGLRTENGARWLYKPRLYAMFACGVGLLCACFLVTRSLHSEHSITLRVGFVGNDLWCTALLALALLPGTALNRWTNNHALRFIGRYSYGLYLWHELPGHVFERWIVDAQLAIAPRWVSGPAATFVLFGFCLLVAMASYHAVELPFLRLKRYFSYDAASSAGSLRSQSESIDLRVPESSL